ncbi:DUF1766-domain-containing protein [Penicillium canescens]|uniref:DUF1766-domain-containing protein n=1 Tax=Penicillium canescens TaxID=5083 RepID=A0AAD6I929_PENCN|nr:DUF1766-domain-containing protein [Penicillium canescens]KAJ6020132.1 DUF1766-domain-containing protein [Penicillium canescens]KAJ6038078.1 DUF1766-domain-containing protein [Penicillium canescens]KAJ6045487.1 DUF1766-domain-containing protein [Penicillium canescens]KAJ6061168.1 DUF1766-domain-containing protein [Penicillium canescens]KAJ6090711.1 DUF1766-domain-containing protein [Penicillium canescens]
MNSNRKTTHTIPSGKTFIPESPDIRDVAAYPSPPNSPREREGVPLTTCEDFGQKLGSSTAVLSASAVNPTNSLNHVTRSSTPDADPRDETVLPEASNLKSLFGIDDWRCGGLTKDQTPCSRPVANKLRDRIENHIDSMIVRHPSSPQFQLDLEKLVDLMHCRQHRRGYVKQMRLDTWTDSLPSGPGRAPHGTSIERKIGLCFGRISTQCMGTTGENKRCNKPIGGQKAQNCTKTIKKITNADVYLNKISLDYFLRVLSTNMKCHLHTKQSSLKELASWKERIEDVLERASSVPEPLKESNTTVDPQRQVLIKSSPATRKFFTEQKHILSPAGLEGYSKPYSISVGSVKDLVTYWLDQYDTTPFDIVERSDRPDDHRASYDGVRSQMKKQLSATDQKNGYLYIYEVEGNKGFLKIGYTTRTIEKRHEEWCFDCNRKSNPLFPIPGVNAALVPNARRVEKLCHAELKHRQVIIYCQGCLKTHEEWFEMSPTKAMAVIEKWSAWMKKGPYEPDRLLLKQVEARKASDMDKYMDAL